MIMRNPLIEKQFVETSFGRIAYVECGSKRKPPVLFVHGIPTSSYLWRHVIRFLQNDFHCYAPDLMGLGDSEVDPASDCFHMDAQAEMLLEVMETMGHQRFGVVCHDQGGAAVQILMARRPEVIDRLVITDCVCYDNWPVPVIARFQRIGRIPGVLSTAGRFGITEWFETRGPISAFRRGVYDPARFPVDAIREYLRPLVSGKTERARFIRFLMAGSPRYTMEAVEGIKRFNSPTRVIWAAEDRYISPSWGKRLFEDIPGAERFELIPFCGHFWQEERPSEFASLIGEFLAQNQPRGSKRSPRTKRAAERTA